MQFRVDILSYTRSTRTRVRVSDRASSVRGRHVRPRWKRVGRSPLDFGRVEGGERREGKGGVTVSASRVHRP